jgi:uncharacterized protein YkwD
MRDVRTYRLRQTAGVLATLAIALVVTLAPAPVWSEGPPESGLAKALRQGCQAAEKGKTARAIALLKQVLAATPESVTAHQYLAFTYQRADKRQEAEAEYRWLALCSIGCAQTPLDVLPQKTRVAAECEARSIYLVNATRKQSKLKVLLVEPKLCVVARGHCAEMRDLGYWGHYSPSQDKRTVLERFVLVYKFEPEVVTENIACHPGQNSSLNPINIEVTHQELMNSPHHRANILHRGVSKLGVGLAADERGDYWLGQVMAEFGAETIGDDEMVIDYNTKGGYSHLSQ